MRRGFARVRVASERDLVGLTRSLATTRDLMLQLAGDSTNAAKAKANPCRSFR